MTRVMLVDDHEDNLYYLSTLLSAHGYEVDTARHGAEALVKSRAHPPTVIVSDLLMPTMDGYTLLRHWKADARLKSIPFIVFTATYTEPEDERLALDLGADLFVLKPCEPDLFLSKLGGVLSTAENLPPALARQESEDGHLRQYSETLIRKLEQKSMQLEDSNRRLQADLVARGEIESALRDSEERFRQLAENIDDVFWLSDPRNEVILYVSPAYESVWGRPLATLVAAPSSWRELIHPEDRERVSAELTNYATGTWSDTYRIVRPDGVVRWVRTRTYPVRDPGGEVYRVAAVSRDITEYRRLEDQFRQAQKMEAIGRLAGGIAHDFNNMMSVVLCYTSLTLADLPLGDPMRADIEEIRKAADRAVELTRQLLAFGRQQMLQPRVVELARVVADTEKMLRRLLGEDIELALFTSRTSGRVHADPSQLDQIVMNLALNARDAMPNGGKLTIDVDDVELDEAYVAHIPGLAAGRYVLLAVTDSGGGMDAATRERIFEPFFTTKEAGKGTGLGLATVFGIVKQSRGHIHVYSEVGLGTTFKIYLPATESDLETPPPPPPEPLTLRGHETILLVEDDAQVRQVNRAILHRQGYTVLDAQNAGEALIVSEKHPGVIDLLLTDVVMPRMSGRELASRLLTQRQAMKVLFVSGYTESAVVRHGVLDPARLPDATRTAPAGTLDFLSKPITPGALLRKVREVLDA